MIISLQVIPVQSQNIAIANSFHPAAKARSKR